MTLKVNHENMRATYHFGLKTLFDGYLTALEFLCDGYVIDDVVLHHNMLEFQWILCDGYDDRPLDFMWWLFDKVKKWTKPKQELHIMTPALKAAGWGVVEGSRIRKGEFLSTRVV